VLVLASVVSPFAAARDGVRAQHEDADVPFYEVHVATPVDVCAARDVKGLYARQRDGGMSGLTGIDGEYEPPVEPDLRIETTNSTVDDAVESLITLVRKENLL
jgi:adenylylsulfate kinase